MTCPLWEDEGGPRPIPCLFRALPRSYILTPRVAPHQCPLGQFLNMLQFRFYGIYWQPESFLLRFWSWNCVQTFRFLDAVGGHLSKSSWGQLSLVGARILSSVSSTFGCIFLLVWLFSGLFFFPFLSPLFLLQIQQKPHTTSISNQ